MNDDELYHYGVKGMKWGVRRQKIASKGDTVPKGTSRKGYGVRTHVGKGGSTRKYTRDMYRTQVTLNGKTMKEHASNARQSAQAKIQQTKQKLSTPEAKAKMKKAAIAGAVVAGTALAVYGGYKLNKYVKSESTKINIQNGRKIADKLGGDLHTLSVNTEGTFMSPDEVRKIAKSYGFNDSQAGRISSKAITEHALNRDAGENLGTTAAWVADRAGNVAYEEYMNSRKNEKFINAAKNVYNAKKRKRR